MNHHDSYILQNPLDRRENEIIQEEIINTANDEGAVSDILCTINDLHPTYLLECYTEGVDPREGDLFDRYLKQYAIDQLTDLGIL